MKKFRKILSVVLTLVMVLAMAVPGFAATGMRTIKIKDDTSGHNYAAYQIFSGTLSNGKNTLSDIQWGDGVDNNSIWTELAADVTIGADFSKVTNAEDQTAEKAAEILANYGDDSANLDAFAAVISNNLTTTVSGTLSEHKDLNPDSSITEMGYEITGLADGYYLVKDNGNVSSGDAYTKFIVQLAGTDAVIARKSDVPEIVKKVYEEDYTEPDNEYGIGYNDVADYSIGDPIQFKLIGSLPENYADYSTYYYQFTDKFGAKFEVDGSSFSAYYASSVNAESGTEISLAGLVSVDNDTNHNFTITFENLKTAVPTASSGGYIIVTYTAKLTAAADMGTDGNVNSATLTFSNNPNDESAGNVTTTPEDEVVVYTYELDVDKVDAVSKAYLKGAEFKLYKEVVEGSVTKYAYANVANGKVTGFAAPQDRLWTEGAVGAYGTTLSTTSAGDAYQKIVIAGLEDGTYYLQETKAPDGYNKIQPIKVVISATTSNGNEWDGEKVALTLLSVLVDDGKVVECSNLSNGNVTINVENKAGAILPSTGGIGTTIFYAAGIVLMAGAVFFVVRRKRA